MIHLFMACPSLKPFDYLMRTPWNSWAQALRRSTGALWSTLDYSCPPKVSHCDLLTLHSLPPLFYLQEVLVDGPKFSIAENVIFECSVIKGAVVWYFQPWKRRYSVIKDLDFGFLSIKGMFVWPIWPSGVQISLKKGFDFRNKSTHYP